MRIMDADKVDVQRGDMVCLRTGFDRMLLGMNKQPDADLLHASNPGLAGRDERLLRWISDVGLVSLISDNFGVEIFPPQVGHTPCHARLPLHEHCLFKIGVNLGELWYLSELADWLRQQGRSRFFLTAPPLNLPGAVGAPATPIGTV